MESAHLNAYRRLCQLLPWFLTVAGLLLMADLSPVPSPPQDLEAYQHYLQQQVAPKVHVGDWVVRAGTGHESQLIQQLSGNPYSHIGVISQIQPEIRVIHATTTDDHKRLNQVISSSLAEFTQSKWATTWAVYRHTGLSNNQIQQQIHDLNQMLGQPFVFESRENHPRYCTTIVYDSLPVSIQQQVPWQTVSLSVIKGDLLFPKAFIELKGSQLIYQQAPSAK
jgi:hypothetical protein